MKCMYMHSLKAEYFEMFCYDSAHQKCSARIKKERPKEIFPYSTFVSPEHSQDDSQ